MDNYSWDVVYACSGSYVNKQLTKNPDKYIQSFNYSDSSIEMSGEFGPWQIVPGGSSNVLQFNCPIEAGELLIRDNNQTISLSGTVPLVQMQLALIKGPDQSISHRLVFNCTTVGKQAGDTAPGAVTIINPDITGVLEKEKYGGLAADLLVTGLSKCFVENADQLSYVFADVLPVPTGQNSNWLMPKTFSYCYEQPEDGSLGGVAILGLLDSDSDAKLPRTFDPALLENKDFGFLLSAHQFMKNIILPGLPEAMGGNAAINDFALSSDAIITLENNFHLDKVKVAAVHYTPEVQSLTFQVENTYMRFYIATKTDITGLTHAYVKNSVSSKNQASFDVNTRMLSFEKDPNMVTTQDKHIPWWEKALGVFTLGIMNEIIAGISTAIENAVDGLDEGKTAENFGQIAPGLVSWTGQKEITVTAGGLADNIFMQGVMSK